MHAIKSNVNSKTFNNEAYLLLRVMFNYLRTNDQQNEVEIEKIKPIPNLEDSPIRSKIYYP